ncbi:MAG: protein kinase [Pirellulaceae bacterium]
MASESDSNSESGDKEKHSGRNDGTEFTDPALTGMQNDTVEQSGGERRHAQDASQAELRQIGPYRLTEKIAEGGMGAVFVAEQEEPIKRRVALKLIKSGQGSEQIVARFRAERQALAMMDHPNISKIFDAGTSESGEPYFVMELVNGVPFTQYCDEKRLSVAERLKLFVPVCEAVQHAHQKGVIHRDLKPSNVLVGLVDGVAIPKVIDFGLAKATEQSIRLTDESMATEFGRVLGTFEYMSPEQASMDSMDVDTRTDIYSLGVMLYELLTGSTPLNHETAKQRVIWKILELIRDAEPPLPSQRLSSAGEDSASISNARRIGTQQLHHILKGELDWVVMRALEKQRDRRYSSASDFARDLGRYLKNEPVEARPPSLGYRAAKTIQRHRYAVSLAGVFLATVLVALGFVTYWYFEASRLASDNAKIAKEKTTLAAERDEAATSARSEADDQRATTQFLLDVFGASDPMFSKVVSRYGITVGQETTVLSLILSAISVEVNDKTTQFADRPSLRSRILAGLGEIAVSSGNLRLGRKALDKSFALLGPGEVEEIDRGKLLVTQALVDYTYGDMRLAEEHLSEAESILETAIREGNDETLVLRKYLDIDLILGMVYIESDRFEDATARFQSMAKRDLDRGPSRSLRQLAGELFALGSELERRAIADESPNDLIPQMVWLGTRWALASNQFNPSVAKPLTAAIQSLLNAAAGRKAASVNNIESMVEAMQSVLGKRHILNALPLFYASVAFDQQDQVDTALEYNTRVLELIDQELGVRRHPRLCQILTMRGKLLLFQWRASTDKATSLLLESEEALTKAIEIGEPFFGRASWRVARAYLYRGRVYREQGEFDRAESDFQAAWESRKASYGEEDNRTKSVAAELEQLRESKEPANP